MSTARCPYCGISATLDSVKIACAAMNEGGRKCTAFQCPSCRHDFVVKIDVTIKTTSHKIEGEN